MADKRLLIHSRFADIHDVDALIAHESEGDWPAVVSSNRRQNRGLDITISGDRNVQIIGSIVQDLDRKPKKSDSEPSTPSEPDKKK